ncbi:hypothetical protein GCM10009552_38590 [Rothia nasimurium]
MVLKEKRPPSGAFFVGPSPVGARLARDRYEAETIRPGPVAREARSYRGIVEARFYRWARLMTKSRRARVLAGTWWREG